MTRTYGTYEYQSPPWAKRNQPGEWILTVDAAVRARVRRIFGRTKIQRNSTLLIADTLEVARDIQWLLERFPLEPVNETSRRYLAEGATAFREQEEIVGQIMAGTYQRPELVHAPAKEPREYQLAAVDLLRAKGRMLLTDEVGLGKTFTGLLSLMHPDALPALVVPPTHLPKRWETELKDAYPFLTVEVAKGTKPSVRAGTGRLADVTIVPYSRIEGWADTLQNQMQTVIFDEVQELRNGTNTDKGTACARVADGATYVQGLSATPIYNYGPEIWNIFSIVAPGELGTKEEFMREWGGTEGGAGKTVRDPAALGAYLREMGLMLGRTREEVGRQLPETIKIPHIIESGTKALDKVKKDARAMAELLLSDTATAQEKFQAAGQIDWTMRQATGVDKAPFVAGFVRMLMQSEDKIVLFGWHREVYEVWAELLADFDPLFYTGTESPKQKAEAEDLFCKPRFKPTEEQIAAADETTRAAWAAQKDHRILIMSLRSGAGVDGLQKFARVAVFGELDWSPQVHEQAIGRLRRDDMGADPVVAYFLNSSEGSDPPMMDVLNVKRQQSEPMLSKTGQLNKAAPIDPQKTRRLAEQILGITAPTESEAISDQGLRSA
jgi:hypothetical protein